ncbi:MAG: hypothetical protein PHX25_03720 [Candidatus Pacebacteria bacterium]|nr:hypothetical protein [Candidatus Paceibacterota bacterium]
MDFIDVKEAVLRDMAKTVGIGPKQIQCTFCKTIVGGKLPNGKKNSFIFGVSKNHIRIIHGIHESVAFYTKEEMICICERCQDFIKANIPQILISNDTSEPIKGGHFITTFKVNSDGKSILISRFQGDLVQFRGIIRKLSS